MEPASRTPETPLITRPAGFRGHVVGSRRLTPTTAAIEVEKPETFDFRPTQFTFLQLMTEAGMETRPMSIATSPTRRNLEYAVRLSDSQFKRAFAALQPGDEVTLFGPLGDFVLRETRPAVLVAGGIGVTPLKGMSEYAADRGLPIPVRLVYSSASEEEIVYRHELAALEQVNPRFRVFHTLSQAAGPGWRGARGRIDREILQEAGAGLTDPVFYVSGRAGMVRTTLQLLSTMGVQSESIEVESFRGYG